jgi:cyclopropane fatty-acyl-phospholipid synthase-like methyltransferase
MIERISPRDQMAAEEVDWYMSIGRSALRCIQVARFAAGLNSVEDILDFGCGHGRVMRFLEDRFPDARLTACDVDEDGVAFCAETFGAKPVVSDADPARIEIDDRFDLIWSGSVLTHFDRDRWQGFLRLFESLLKPGGVAVFTTHGEKMVEQLRTRSATHDLSEARIEALLSDYDRDGFAFDAEYNVSLSSPAVVLAELKKIPLRTVTLLEHGWNEHQDVFGVCSA